MQVPGAGTLPEGSLLVCECICVSTRVCVSVSACLCMCCVCIEAPVSLSPTQGPSPGVGTWGVTTKRQLSAGTSRMSKTRSTGCVVRTRTPVPLDGGIKTKMTAAHTTIAARCECLEITPVFRQVGRKQCAFPWATEHRKLATRLGAQRWGGVTPRSAARPGLTQDDALRVQFRACPANPPMS